MLIPWACGKPLACDVTVPDTYVQSHIGETAESTGAATINMTKATVNKTKYTCLGCLTTTYHFVSTAVEAGGPGNAAEFVADLGKRIS